ncbi:O-antigen ligase family protein [Caulobacter hibisci]|uniref:O-antigen ligase family protein n=1 Tax=Caulobacter hibisci TaxID=2035993 RepID=A0ABS0STJ8_9CAUL|nr:O-antigen ligase family protein [Caulobacter hibisci]MBI1682923.1 O-antigen ligase family protein [Caulobacter hibisci]
MSEPTFRQNLPDSGKATPWLGGVMILLFVMTPVLGYFAQLGFAPLLALVGLLALPVMGRPRAPVAPALILLLLALWGAWSMTWSPAAPPPGSLKAYDDIEKLTAAKLLLQLALYGAAVAAALRLSTRAADRASTFIGFGVLALAILVGGDALIGAKIFQKLRELTGDPVRPDIAKVKIGIGCYVLAVLFWPAAAALARRGKHPAVVLLLAGVIAASVLASADSCLVALGVGLLVWALIKFGGKAGGGVLTLAVAVPFVVAPIAVLAAIQTGFWAWLHGLVPPSWDARLNIWAFAADHVQTHPFRGWGLDASRTFGDAIPLHTHNAQLQLWLELGAVGAALAGAFFCWLAYGVTRTAETDRGSAATAGAALTSYLVIGALSFGVWQEWWIAIGALAIVACVALRRSSSEYGDELVEISPLG